MSWTLYETDNRPPVVFDRKKTGSLKCIRFVRLLFKHVTCSYFIENLSIHSNCCSPFSVTNVKIFYIYVAILDKYLNILN